MATSILNIGVSGLNAAQTGILTTSHNISNSSTPGFSRQQIVQTTSQPQFTGSGFLGTGTDVSTVRRLYSSFLSQQVLSAQAGVSQADAYQAQIDQIDNLLADSSAGLAPAMNAFFAGVQDVAANPSSISSRQSMLSSAEAMAARFQALDTRLNEIRSGVNSQIDGSVANINSLSTQIADLNQRIVLAQASGTSQPANDLLDQRDQLVADLNKEIRATTITQSDGTYSVFIGNGQPLVVGTQAFQLQAVAAPDDVSRTVIAMQMPGSGTTVLLQESLLTGGTLGGLIAFRSQSLDAAQNALGRIAIGLADAVNAQHQLGQDLTGALGGDLFSVGTPAVFANANNTGGTTLTATLDNVGELTTSDYQLTFNAGVYTLTRLSDNTSWTGASASAAATAAAQGFSLAIGTPPPVPANGDSFLIEPTRSGAHSISVLISDPRSIAAAAPIRTAAALANTGTASISPGTVNPTPGTPDPAHPSTDVNLRQPVTISFTSATTYSVSGTGIPAGTTGTYTAGGNISFNGWTVQISGNPATGDVFSVGPNSNGVADNRNILALGQIQTAKVLEDDAAGNGTASLTSAYAQIVSSTGAKAREVLVTGQAQQSLLDSATASQQSLSGVNLDEEAANLLRYQQAYQASAKVIATASKLFDAILALGS